MPSQEGQKHEFKEIGQVNLGPVIVQSDGEIVNLHSLIVVEAFQRG